MPFILHVLPRLYMITMFEEAKPFTRFTEGCHKEYCSITTATSLSEFRLLQIIVKAQHMQYYQLLGFYIKFNSIKHRREQSTNKSISVRCHIQEVYCCRSNVSVVCVSMCNAVAAVRKYGCNC